ncbi:MAG: cupredoxin domain-containing protein [Gemmatimonadales bacterium]
MARGIAWSVVALLLAACFSERDPAAPSGERCSLPITPAVPGSTLVPIADFTFQPGEVRVRAGQSVTWANCDVDLHTSTSDAAGWDSPLLAPGEAFTQTFSEVGTFPYHCETHPFMTATVIVE